MKRTVYLCTRQVGCGDHVENRPVKVVSTLEQAERWWVEHSHEYYGHSYDEIEMEDEQE